MAAARLLPARRGHSARTEAAATEAMPRLGADASAAAVAAFLAGANLSSSSGRRRRVAARGAWTPPALAASLGAKTPLKAADAPFSEESWAGLGTKGQPPLGAFLERPDEGLYLDWSLPRNAPEALLDGSGRRGGCAATYCVVVETTCPTRERGRRCSWGRRTRSTCHVDGGVLPPRHGPRPRRREEVARLAARGRGLPVPLRGLGGRRPLRRRESGRGIAGWVVCQKPR